MSEVWDWNVLADSNQDAPPDGAPELQPKTSVAGAARERMAAIARWYGNTLERHFITDDPGVYERVDVFTFKLNGADYTPAISSGDTLVMFDGTSFYRVVVTVALYVPGVDDFTGVVIDPTVLLPLGFASLWSMTARGFGPVAYREIGNAETNQIPQQDQIAGVIERETLVAGLSADLNPVPRTYTTLALFDAQWRSGTPWVYSALPPQILERTFNSRYYGTLHLNMELEVDPGDNEVASLGVRVWSGPFFSASIIRSWDIGLEAYDDNITRQHLVFHWDWIPDDDDYVFVQVAKTSGDASFLIQLDGGSLAPGAGDHPCYMTLQRDRPAGV